MAFVNEYIPEDDRERYNIKPTNHFYQAGISSWTVDRERNIFLMRRTGPSPENRSGETEWAFHWRGHLLEVVLRLLASGGDPKGGHGWARFKLLAIRGLPAEVGRSRDDIVRDLRDALVAHKDSGVFSRRVSFDVTLEA